MGNRSIIYIYRKGKEKKRNKEIYKFDKITLAISSNTVYNIYIR